MTVSDVLTAAGHPLGARNRTTCPLPTHRGDNPQSFSYREEVWHCFGCGENGGVKKLREAILSLRLAGEASGLGQSRRTPPTRSQAPSRGGLEGLSDGFFASSGPGPSLFQGLERLRQRRAEDRRRLASWQHEDACRALQEAELVWRLADLSADPDWVREVALELAEAGVAELRAADAVLGCSCRAS